MLQSVKTIEKRLVECEINEKNNWIHLTNPSILEIDEVCKLTGAERELINYCLDEEESSRIDFENDQALVILNASVEDTDSEHTSFNTYPFGILFLKDHIVTVCLEELRFINRINKMSPRYLDTTKATQFAFHLIDSMISDYNKDLQKISRSIESVDESLGDRTFNDEIILSLLDAEKTLVYFTTSINKNEVVIRKILRTPLIQKFEEDKDLIEDVLIEVDQAKETVNNNVNIARSIREAGSSVLNNELNITMKNLTSITIVMTIPTMVFSFYGMNISFGSYINHQDAIIWVIAGTVVGYKTP